MRGSPSSAQVCASSSLEESPYTHHWRCLHIDTTFPFPGTPQQKRVLTQLRAPSPRSRGARELTHQERWEELNPSCFHQQQLMRTKDGLEMPLMGWKVEDHCGSLWAAKTNHGKRFCPGRGAAGGAGAGHLIYSLNSPVPSLVLTRQWQVKNSLQVSVTDSRLRADGPGNLNATCSGVLLQIPFPKEIPTLHSVRTKEGCIF